MSYWSCCWPNTSIFRFSLVSLIADSQGSEAERFRVGKPLGNRLSQPSQCMEEEIETQKDETNWSADFPANAFPTQNY